MSAGNVNWEGYKTLKAAPGTYRSALDGGDSADLDTSISLIPVHGNTTLAVSARFSNASATCVLTAVLWHVTQQGTETPLGQNTSTATADAAYEIGGDFVAPTLFFDTAGATHYEVRAADPSAGDVNLVTWVYGAASQ